MTADEFITEAKRIAYEEDWCREMFDDINQHRDFFLSYHAKGYTPEEMMDELESEEY